MAQYGGGGRKIIAWRNNVIKAASREMLRARDKTEKGRYMEIYKQENKIYKRKKEEQKQYGKMMNQYLGGNSFFGGNLRR